PRSPAAPPADPARPPARPVRQLHRDAHAPRAADARAGAVDPGQLAERRGSDGGARADAGRSLPGQPRGGAAGDGVVPAGGSFVVKRSTRATTSLLLSVAQRSIAVLRIWKGLLGSGVASSAGGPPSRTSGSGCT